MLGVTGPQEGPVQGFLGMLFPERAELPLSPLKLDCEHAVTNKNVVANALKVFNVLMGVPPRITVYAESIGNGLPP